MRRFTLTSAVFFALFVLVASNLYSQDQSKTEGPSFGGFLRPDWVIQNVDDPYRDNIRIYHFLTRSRLFMKGAYEGIRYRVELGFTGPEAEIPVSRSGFWGMVQLLQDFYADVPFPGLKNVYVRVGQFKIPAGAEALTYSADMPFVERSIAQKFVGLLRDYGVALHAYPAEKISFALALQTGLGRSIPNRYLPEVFGFPFVTARIQYGSNAGHDLFRLKPALSGQDMEVRIGANATYYKDFLAGHSTALNVWNKEKPILLQGGWNPYIGLRPLDPGTLLIAGGDVALGFPSGRNSLWLEGQATFGQYENDSGKVSVTAVRAQATYSLPAIAFGLRYTLIQPSDLGAGKIGDDLIHEITPMISFQIVKHVRLILDGSILMDVPVAVEDGVGVYVLTDHPEEISMDMIERKTVTNIRAAIQIDINR